LKSHLSFVVAVRGSVTGSVIGPVIGSMSDASSVASSAADDDCATPLRLDQVPLAFLRCVPTSCCT
jgi:hypothetical protein